MNESKCLSEYRTSQLVRELEKRLGVEMVTAAPYQDVEIKVNGPAIVLIVTD